MKTSDLLPKSSPTAVSRYEDSVINIYQYLNQGNLYRIYQLLDDLNSPDEKRRLEEHFVRRFGFNYRAFI